MRKQSSKSLPTKTLIMQSDLRIKKNYGHCRRRTHNISYTFVCDALITRVNLSQ